MDTKMNNGEEFQSYSDYLMGSPRYVRVPKKLLVDKNLKESERKLWQVLASFQHEAYSEIFPTRYRLAKLMGIESVNSISRLSQSLEKKGYLTKEITRDNKVYYTLHLRTKVREASYFGKMIMYKDRPNSSGCDISTEETYFQ